MQWSLKNKQNQRGPTKITCIGIIASRMLLWIIGLIATTDRLSWIIVSNRRHVKTTTKQEEKTMNEDAQFQESKKLYCELSTLKRLLWKSENKHAKVLQAS